MELRADIPSCMFPTEKTPQKGCAEKTPEQRTLREALKEMNLFLVLKR